MMDVEGVRCKIKDWVVRLIESIGIELIFEIGYVV